MGMIYGILSPVGDWGKDRGTVKTFDELLGYVQDNKLVGEKIHSAYIGTVKCSTPWNRSAPWGVLITSS